MCCRSGPHPIDSRQGSSSTSTSATRTRTRAGAMTLARSIVRLGSLTLPGIEDVRLSWAVILRRAPPVAPPVARPPLEDVEAVKCTVVRLRTTV